LGACWRIIIYQREREWQDGENYIMRSFPTFRQNVNTGMNNWRIVIEVRPGQRTCEPRIVYKFFSVN
jgi:hypothetical protein